MSVVVVRGSSSQVQRMTGGRVSARQIDEFMVIIGDDELKRHGIWRFSLGSSSVSIVLINPAFGSAVSKREADCSCVNIEQGDRYFSSDEYFAGRHKSAASKNKPNCSRWEPPSTGHLHSWRRQFSE